jgi:NRPS condensation-like uncharacterized protein
VNVTTRAFQAEFSDAVYLATGATHGHPAGHVALDLSRRFSRQVLRDAVTHLIEMFPVLGCRYEARFWRDRWVPDASSVDSLVHVGDFSGADRHAWLEHWINRPIDPARERPFRIAQRETGSGSTLLISVAHAASDGAGIAAIVYELACSLYGAKSSAEPSRERGIGQLVRALSSRQLAALPAGVMEGGVGPFKLTRVADRRRPASIDGSAASRFKTVVLDGSAYEAFRRCCASVGATLNDGLAAAIASLSATQTDDGPVVVYYTANLRRYLSAPKAIAGNLSGGEVMIVPRAALRSLAETAQTAARITSAQKDGVPGLGLAVFQWLTVGWLPHSVLRNVVVPRLDAASVSLFRKALVLTNVGAFDRFVEPFGADLLAVSVMGPFADSFPVPLVVSTGFRSSITLQICAGTGFPEQELDAFVEQLTRILRSPELSLAIEPRPTAA